MLEQGIREALAGDSTISNLTGNRIRPLIGAQDDIQPRIAFKISNDDPIQTFGGASRFSTATVEIDSIADTYKACAQLSAEVKRIFNGTAVMTSTVRITPSTMTDESDIEQAVIEGTEQPVYLRTQTFEMLYFLL